MKEREMINGFCCILLHMNNCNFSVVFYIYFLQKFSLPFDLLEADHLYIESISILEWFSNSIKKRSLKNAASVQFKI